MAETDHQKILQINGTCPICGPGATFSGMSGRLRDTFACSRCKSIPRERALFEVLKTLYPNWKDIVIHEFLRQSGAARVQAFRRNCTGYTYSQYDTSIPWGATQTDRGHRSENLESLTFADNTFDAFVTQDVFEHIFRPDLAAREIARVLKPNGSHILTTPLVSGRRPSRRRAQVVDGQVVNLLPPIYHGNPMSKTGSLVTVDWGLDILQYLSTHSGLQSMLFYYDDISRGLRAPFH